MKYDLKRELAEAFIPPEPKARDGFLAAFFYPKLTYPEFVLSQIRYIRKRVWFASIIVLLAGIGTVCIMPENSMMLIWGIASLIPLLAVLTAAEISRSDMFGMSELEGGCRFALPQVVGARMIILGVCDFLVIAASTVILGVFSPLDIARSALYILTPYVLVNGSSLAIFNRVRGQDGVYLSVAVAFAVSLAGMIFSGREFYDRRAATLFMAAVCAAGWVLTVVQIKKMLIGKDNYYGATC